MITCNLTKLESAFDNVRKTFPKLKPTDAALVSSALVLTGRHAIALYSGTQYRWPEDYEKLTKEMAKELEEIKTHLVHKANGSFYPFLSKAGGKEESS